MPLLLLGALLGSALTFLVQALVGYWVGRTPPPSPYRRRR